MTCAIASRISTPGITGRQIALKKGSDRHVFNANSPVDLTPAPVN
jgi:hypothetical protein